MRKYNARKAIVAIVDRFGIDWITAQFAYDNPEFEFVYRGILGTLADHEHNYSVWAELDAVTV